MQASIQILLVDDNPYFLEAAREFLLLEGGFPLAGVATTDEEAIAQALQLKPAVILLDLNLAGRSGLDLIPMFREKLPSARIIVMTLMEGSAYCAAALQAGADEFILKNEMNVKLLPLIRASLQPAKAPHADDGHTNKHSHLEEQLRRLVSQPESIRDALVVSDADYIMTNWNMAAEAMYGWKAEEVLGRNALDVIQTQYPEGNREKMLQFIARTGGYRGEVTQVRKDGTRFPVHVSSVTLRDENGELIGYASIHRDLSRH